LAAETAISAQDKTFVQQAAIGGLAEVQEGPLATVRAASAAVKEFGQQMIDQHTPNNQALATLATAKGVSFSATMDEAHMADAAALKNAARHSLLYRLYRWAGRRSQKNATDHAGRNPKRQRH
jgi:putative membrane protein